MIICGEIYDPIIKTLTQVVGKCGEGPHAQIVDGEIAQQVFDDGRGEYVGRRCVNLQFKSDDGQPSAPRPRKIKR